MIQGGETTNRHGSSFFVYFSASFKHSSRTACIRCSFIQFSCNLGCINLVFLFTFWLVGALLMWWCCVLDLFVASITVGLIYFSLSNGRCPWNKQFPLFLFCPIIMFSRWWCWAYDTLITKVEIWCCCWMMLWGYRSRSVDLAWASSSDGWVHLALCLTCTGNARLRARPVGDRKGSLTVRKCRMKMKALGLWEVKSAYPRRVSSLPLYRPPWLAFKASVCLAPSVTALVDVTPDVPNKAVIVHVHELSSMCICANLVP